MAKNDTISKLREHRTTEKIRELAGLERWVDPTLGNVLHALREVWGVERGFFVNQYGIFYEVTDEFKSPARGWRFLVDYAHLGWKINQDRFSKQLPQLKNFVADLLRLEADDGH